MIDVAKLVDMRKGTQSKEIFLSQSVYELELERIFARSWLFLAHECQLPNVGDYVTTRMGEDEVIVARQRDRSIKAFLNTCRHRGAQVCPAEAGNARGFVCSYHGWAYGLDGKLEAVPFEKELYKCKLDKSVHGLEPVAQIQSYHGFVFGCFDPAAPSLADYFGEYRWYLDIWMDATGGIELIGPPTRSVLRCNWKSPAENFCGDAYHVGWTHAAAFKALGGPLAALAGNAALPPQGAGIQVTTRHGHGIGVLYDASVALQAELIPEIMAWQAQKRPQIEKELGATRARFYSSHLNANIFPNCSYLWGTNAFKLWQPRGPAEIEVLTWTIVEKDMPTELKDKLARSLHRTFGAAGILEADDNDNMESISRLGRGFMSRRGNVNSEMGLGADTLDAELPGVVGRSAIGETSYRGFYRFYQEMLAASSWDEIRSRDGTWSDALTGADTQTRPASNLPKVTS